MAPSPPDTSGYSSLINRSYRTLYIKDHKSPLPFPRTWSLTFDNRSPISGDLADFILDSSAVASLLRRKKKRHRKQGLPREGDVPWTEEEREAALRESVKKGNFPPGESWADLEEWVRREIEERKKLWCGGMGQGESKDVEGMGVGPFAVVQAEGGADGDDAMDVDEGQEQEGGGGVEGRAFHDNNAVQTPHTSRLIPKPKQTTTSSSSSPNSPSTSDLDSLGPYTPPSPTFRPTAFRPFLSRAQKEALKLENRSDQTPTMGKGKKPTVTDDETSGGDMINAPPPFASTRSHTRHAHKGPVALKPQGEGDDGVGGGQGMKTEAKIDEVHGKASRVGEDEADQEEAEEETGISTKTTATKENTTPPPPASPKTTLKTFISTALWPRYCNLSPPAPTPSTSSQQIRSTRVFATTKISPKGVRSPAQSAPEAWLLEVQARLELLLESTREDRREVILKVMQEGARKAHIAQNLLAEEVVWVINRGPLRGGRRAELGVVLELFGLVGKGEIWKG